MDGREEPNAIHRDVAHLLRTRRQSVGRVVRVESAGESGTGDTTVLFTTSTGEARTAFIGNEAYVPKGQTDAAYRTVVVVIEGWPVTV